ncbi:sensor histidine kinase [Salinispira pacifica]|uniref:histidine kinase n=1 Tax=Salinispira pacifica TaxID=1307761 RepID=V5WLI0_9SPIO|nr:HAMP domain-containing sensor histidine kinase [Salinispira pacifica]AHC16464.1 hypothetical protein L21SP2_3122 [Salinispira pacifica]
MKRNLLIETAIILTIIAILSVIMFGIITLMLSNSYLINQLKDTSHETADRLQEILITPLYTLSDETAINIVQAYLGSGVLEGIILESSANGILLNQEPESSSYIGPFMREISFENLELGRVTLWFSNRQIISTQRQLMLIISITVVAMSGVLLLSIFLLSRFKIKKTLTGVIYGIGQLSKGNYSCRIEREQYRDVNLFIDRLNAMAEHIEEKEQSLLELNENLEHKVAERTREVEETSQRLRNAERLVSLGNLVVGISHELNTPLGNALTTVSYLENLAQKMQEGNEPAHPRMLSEPIAIIQKSLNKAIRLIRSFRQITIPQEDKPPARIYVKKYLQDVAELTESQMEGKNVSVTVDGPEFELTISPAVLYPIIFNLIANAAEHGYETEYESGAETSAQQTSTQQTTDPVEFQLERQDGNIFITCTDHGTGIDPAILPKVFEPFFTTKRGEGKTGLGLYIVNSVVTTQLQGWVELRSTPGRGTTVLISFPVPPVSG